MPLGGIEPPGGGSDEPLCSGGIPAFRCERCCGGGDGVLAEYPGVRERPCLPVILLTAVSTARTSGGSFVFMFVFMFDDPASCWPAVFFRVFALVLRASSVVAE